MNKYKPSNGTEGMIFTDEYCMNCIHCDPNPEGEKQCDILLRTMCYDLNDKEYPEEWTYNEKEEPICTAWKKWNWGAKGNPDDPNNPNYQEPHNPNQLILF
jgi:hypothetical protein